MVLFSRKMSKLAIAETENFMYGKYKEISKDIWDLKD
jgi:hypothetical protein